MPVEQRLLKAGLDDATAWSETNRAQHWSKIRTDLAKGLDQNAGLRTSRDCLRRYPTRHHQSPGGLLRLIGSEPSSCRIDQESSATFRTGQRGEVDRLDRPQREARIAQSGASRYRVQLDVGRPGEVSPVLTAVMRPLGDPPRLAQQL